MINLKIERGIRLRVANALATFCIFIVGTLGIALYLVSDNIEEDHIKQVLTMEMEHIVHLYKKHQDYIPHIGSSLKSYVIREADDEFQMPSYLRGLDSPYRIINYNYKDIRVAVRHDEGVKFLVAYRTDLHQQRLKDLRLMIVFSLVLVVSIAFAVGYLLAGFLVKQMTDLAKQVRLLAPGYSKDITLTRPGMDEEVAQLAHALDDYQNRIQRLIQREQEFTANISHELRTPITTILTSCELLDADLGLSDKVRLRVKRIETAATQMGEQLQVLLFLAREQALGVMEPVAIAECVCDAVEPVYPEIYRKKLTFESNVASNVIITLNRQALHTALTNLLRNAVQYTEKGFIRVEFHNRCLVIKDSGIGIEPAFMPLLYERFFRGSSEGEGLGIGMPIVKRICDHYGWKIEVKSKPGKGTEFQITFPE